MQQLNCKYCYQACDRVWRKPYRLECNHIICGMCKNLFSQIEQCPKCQFKIQNLDQLQDSSFLLDLFQQDEIFQCHIHQEQIQYYCKKSNLFLCCNCILGYQNIQNLERFDLSKLKNDLDSYEQILQKTQAQIEIQIQKIKQFKLLETLNNNDLQQFIEDKSVQLSLQINSQDQNFYYGQNIFHQQNKHMTLHDRLRESMSREKIVKKVKPDNLSNKEDSIQIIGSQKQSQKKRQQRQIQRDLTKINQVKQITNNNLMDQECIDQLKSWLQTDNLNQQLIYKGSEHDFDMKKFHELCDNQCNYYSNLYQLMKK